MERDLSPGTRLLAVVMTLGMLGGILLVIATGVFARLVEVPNESLTREPQAVLDGAAYIGAMSNLGVLAFGLPPCPPVWPPPWSPGGSGPCLPPSRW